LWYAQKKWNACLSIGSVELWFASVCLKQPTSLLVHLF
jgi:hypothetical protein